ncbi:hypothetical protein PINS_up011780 [Pythium insidiosum]|nr:hypothetical protein PINS_up011780 [Pythium insidiosum]
MYISIALMLLQTLQYGWTGAQLNLSTFHSREDCDARPVAPGTCVLFPGHSLTEWTAIVTAWLVGGMLSSAFSGRLADDCGRKRTYLVSAVVSIVGSVVQTTATRVPLFVVGRFMTGLSAGIASTLVSGYISEVSPPHLRPKLGVLYQASQAAGGTLVVLSFFFFANSSTGWRVITAMPSLLSLLTLIAGSRFLVESPRWLLMTGRQLDAERAAQQLYGASSVPLALAWMQVDAATTKRSQASNMGAASSPWKALFSRAYRRQTTLAVALSIAQQLSGSNAVFLYSSSIFKTAGVSDDRVGTLLVCLCSLLPTLASGAIAARLGNRTMLLAGHVAMLLCALGMTLALSVGSSVLSIGFTALYITSYALSLGPLVFVVVPTLFPDALRATGTALCLAVNWSGTLLVGASYPFVLQALGDLGFVPFVVSLAVSGAFFAVSLPETAALSSSEIQSLFQVPRARRVSAIVA